MLKLYTIKIETELLLRIFKNEKFFWDLKQTDYIVEKLNDLVILNEEIESAYNKASNELKFADNVAFSKQSASQRNKFIQVLNKELKRYDENNEMQIVLKRRFHLIRTNFKQQVKIGNDLDFLSKVYSNELLCVNKYDELLSQINLPLSLCRALLKQRDIVQARIHLIERGEPIVAAL